MDVLNRKLVNMTSTLLLLVAVLAAGSAVSIAANKATQKQKVVAGAIFKFIKFVEWDAFSDQAKTSFHMCLQHYDPAFKPFTQRKILGKTIKVLLLDEKKITENCDALYLNKEQSSTIEILKSYKNKPVLTISAQPGFLLQGGMMELGSKNNRLTFSINQLAAKAGNLNIGFQLLSLATHVIES